MKFKKGSKVEVLCKKEAPLGSWQCAEIISGNGHDYTVRYEGLGGATVMERVSGKDIRPCPPPLEVSASWVAGDLVEVFYNSSWKLATISKIMGKKYVLVRLLGSSREYKVSKFDVRVRQFWQDDQRTVIGKRSGNYDNGKHDETLNLKANQNSSSQIRKTDTRINPRVNGHCFRVTNKLIYQESHLASSKTRKRSSPYFSTQVDAHAGTPKKLKVIESEGRCHQVSALNTSLLAEQVDGGIPRDVLGEKEAHASFKIRMTRFSEAKSSRKKPSGTVGCSFAANIQPDDGDSISCSVGSCSINSNNGILPCHVSVTPVKDLDCHDAESYCQLRCGEGNCPRPTKEQLAAEIHRLELHAYCCTMEALHASGPLSWEQEEMMTNLRLSLNISNDEHLLELRNLVSGETSIRLR